MNATQLRMIAFLTCILACGHAAQAQDQEPPLMGKVNIESEPRGAEVFLGDSLLGTTPLRIDAAQASRIRVYWPSRRAWNAQVQALPRRPLEADRGVVLVRFTREVRLRSVPHGARVFRGDSLLGATPLTLDADGGAVRIDAVGYESRDWDPSAVGEREAIVMLQPLGSDISPEVHIRTSSMRFPPARVLLPAGLGLAAGVAAVIFKQKADALYNDYLDSGDDSLLSQTKKYDIYAGISLTLLQVGLGYVIYLILDE